MTIGLALATLLASLLLWRGTVRAESAAPPPDPGRLEATRRDGTPLGACPLKHTDVRVDVAGFVARVVVTQTFENPFPDPVEAVYTFPLSERGAVDALTMRTGDRVIHADIKRREEAHRIYEAARTAGQTAALLEQERPNIFTQSLANLMPGAKVDVRIEYVEPLVYRDGTFEFSFPTVVGPRFVPGTPTGRTGTGWAPDTTRVPDASRITPPVTPEGTRAGHDITIVLEVDAGVPILDVVSPLHAIDVERPDAQHARVRLRQQSEIPNRDFVLRYAVAGDEVRSGWLAHRTGDGDGYVSFVLIPPKRVTPETAAPKEMIFVIDRSGSQSGLPLQKAKETMHWILDHMNPRDTFQVVDFGNTANVLFPTPQPASLEMKRAARAHIDGLEANGGTMMAEAVRTVCALPADGNRLRIVTFMTDGYIGNDFEVIDLVRKLRTTSRWFSFGTGNGVNRFLLDGIAKAGGGEVDYVLLNDPGETVAKRFYERIAAPVLIDVRLEFRGLDVVDAYPSVPSDVWDRRPLIVHARYRRAGAGQVVLHGFRRGHRHVQTLDVTLPERSEHAAVASMWARARVDDLMHRDLGALQSGTFPEPLREQIIETALAHRLLTQFTAFVAVEEKIVNEGGRQRRVAVPVEMPQGVRYEGVFGTPAQDAIVAGRMAKQAMSAPLPASEPAARGDGTLSRLRSLGYLAGADGMADRAAPVEERKEREADPAARSRLAPALRALVEGGAPGAEVQVVDGKVTVKVVLRRGGRRTLRMLERAGARIHQVGAGWAIASLAVTDLEPVAALEPVERIELP